MTPLNHPQIYQDDLEDMTLHAMIGVTLESVEHYMLSTFFGHFNDLEVLLCTYFLK